MSCRRVRPHHVSRGRGRHLQLRPGWRLAAPPHPAAPAGAAGRGADGARARGAAGVAVRPSMPFTHLHVHSNYSFLDGGSTVEALVARAQAVGCRALALTDHHGLYGAVRFHQAAAAAGLLPILGAEMTLESGHHLVVLARNRQGFRNLCRLITDAQIAYGKGRARLALET